MRIKLLIVLSLATALGIGPAGASAAKPPPDLVAKRAQARQILKQIDAIDERLSGVVEEYNGARIQLNALRERLRLERRALARAQVENRQAQQRVADLLVTLYTSERPSGLEVLLGAASVSDLLSLLDAEEAIGRQTNNVARKATLARLRLEQVVHKLDVDRAQAQATVRRLTVTRAAIEAALTRRRALLASVKAQVARIEARERARQERLAAAARARLAAEAAARDKAREDAAAKARAAADAKARTVAGQRVIATTTTTTATTSTTTPAGGAAVLPPVGGPAVPLPPGHPEAAQLALQYFGVPYVWAGASPDGFDCSGLVTYVYAQLGILLPHFAASQWDYGVPVPADKLEAGDLVFFNALDHVGIYIGEGDFIAAPHTGSFVRIDSLKSPPYSKHYVGARRL